jgi:hypothetical protein
VGEYEYNPELFEYGTLLYHLEREYTMEGYVMPRKTPN